MGDASGSGRRVGLFDRDGSPARGPTPAEWGSWLVWGTAGGHRRINLPLLRDLESEDQIAGLRIVELRRLRELRSENLELRKQLVNKDRELDALKRSEDSGARKRRGRS
jgi:hypothetical protein